MNEKDARKTCEGGSIGKLKGDVRQSMNESRRWKNERAGRLGRNLMLYGKMYGLSHEGDKYKNRFRFSEIASTGLGFNKWVSCLKKQCLLLWQFSNGGWVF